MMRKLQVSLLISILGIQASICAEGNTFSVRKEDPPSKSVLGAIRGLIRVYNSSEERQRFESDFAGLVKGVQAILRTEASSRKRAEGIADLIFYKYSISPSADMPSQTLADVFKTKLADCCDLSILYLCIAEEVDLPLSLVRCGPHVLIKWADEEKPFYVETTLRGISIENLSVLVDAMLPLKAMGYGVRHFRELSKTQVCAVARYEAGLVKFLTHIKFGISSLESILNEYPEFDIARMTLAELLWRSGKQKEAIETWRLLRRQLIQDSLWTGALCCSAAIGSVESAQNDLRSGGSASGSFWGNKTPVCFALSAEMVRFMLVNGGDPSSSANGGPIPTHWHAWNGNLDAVKALLVSGASTISVDFLGDDILFWSARNPRTECLDYFIEEEGLYFRRNKLGETALHRAAQFGNASAIKKLVGHGWRLDEMNNNGQTALQVAIAYDQSIAEKVLVQLESKFRKPRNVKNNSVKSGIRPSVYSLKGTGLLEDPPCMAPSCTKTSPDQ